MKNTDGKEATKFQNPGIDNTTPLATEQRTSEELKQIELKSKSDKIDEEISKLYPHDNIKDVGPLFDGIINIEHYLKARYKILWILKEPYDYFDEDGDACGGGWDIKEKLNSYNSFKEMTGGVKTYYPMIYSTYGILNGFCAYDSIPDMPDDPNVFTALRSFAYINVKKLPGNTTSSDGIIKSAYNQNKEILLKQISVYDPDIIIGGGTLNYFLDDLGIDKQSGIILHEGSFPYYVKGKQLFIAAYHPSSVGRQVGEEDYCNNIIDPAKILKTILGY